MAEVKYTITADQRPTLEQKRMIQDARIKQEELLREGKKSVNYLFIMKCQKPNWICDIALSIAKI